LKTLGFLLNFEIQYAKNNCHYIIQFPEQLGILLTYLFPCYRSILTYQMSSVNTQHFVSGLREICAYVSSTFTFIADLFIVQHFSKKCVWHIALLIYDVPKLIWLVYGFVVKRVKLRFNSMFTVIRVHYV